MITPPVRTTCAVAAVVLFFLAVAGMVMAGSWVLPLVVSAVFALAAMFGASMPRPQDYTRLAEHFARFRTAMMVCFAAAIGFYCVGAALRNQDAAILAVAFWLVAFVLAFFVVYFRGQLRLAGRAQ